MITTPYTQYWLLDATFHLHFAWITCATFINVNLCFVAYAGDNRALHLGAAVISLASLYLIAVILGYWFRSGLIIPVLVFVWAFFGVSMELSNPMDKIASSFGSTVTDGLSGAAAFMSASMLVFAILISVFPVTRLVKQQG